MEYLIVDQPNPSFLICKVNEFIKTGWKPAGGVSAYVDLERPHFTHFMQAMINKEKETRLRGRTYLWRAPRGQTLLVFF